MAALFCCCFLRSIQHLLPPWIVARQGEREEKTQQPVAPPVGAVMWLCCVLCACRLYWWIGSAFGKGKGHCVSSFILLGLVRVVCQNIAEIQAVLSLSLDLSGDRLK